MKKIFSVLFFVLSFVIITFACSGNEVSAVSLSQGKAALVAQWEKGEDYGVDYRSYSPVKSDYDTTKYPLVVLLHGKFSGTKEGEQVEATDFYKWSSSEYQARFKDAGGSYILMPRTPGGDTITWANSSLQSDLMKLVDKFINENSANIDTSRIYLGGWSMGGAGAISVASKYNDLFAAVVVMAPFDSVTQSQVDDLKNTPVWLITCTKDSTASHVLFAKPFWNSIKDTTNIPSYCRYTTFSKYNYYDAGHHYVHMAVAGDLLSQPSDCGMKTVDAEGRTITTSENESIITWLSEQRLGQAKEEEPCRCNCHSDKGLVKFVWSIQKFIWKLFSPSKRLCGCGVNHW